jgi:hypothetical protein
MILVTRLDGYHAACHYCAGFNSNKWAGGSDVIKFQFLKIYHGDFQIQSNSIHDWSYWMITVSQQWEVLYSLHLIPKYLPFFFQFSSR